jgi:hypothetical protein
MVTLPWLFKPYQDLESGNYEEQLMLPQTLFFWHKQQLQDVPLHKGLFYEFNFIKKLYSQSLRIPSTHLWFARSVCLSLSLSPFPSPHNFANSFDSGYRPFPLTHTHTAYHATVQLKYKLLPGTTQSHP